MTPEITLLSICIISAILCVAVGIQQWRINQLHAENDRERARHEVTNELLTEAKNEAKNEYDLRRQAEKNLAEANEAVTDWRNDAVKYEHIAKELELTCDDMFETLCKAVEKMPVPFHLRKRDENGRFVKASAYDIATNMLINKQIKMDRFGWGMSKPSTLIETDGLTARVVAKPHTLRHGMTVKDPAQSDFDKMMGDPMSQLERLTVRNLCDEVKNNAATGI